MAETYTDILLALDELLDLEREALIEGKLEQLGNMTAEKEKLVDRINALPEVPRSELAPVQVKVNRNQVLLQSALEGIRAVANRMAEMRRVRKGLDTYDRSGKKYHHAADARKKLEKRA